MKLKLRGRRPRPKAFAVLPTLLTLANGVCGFGAIAFASGWAGYEPATALFTAGCLIFLGMLFDGLDGAAARWAGQTSKFGAELDSLCDAISFGAAPAFVMLALAKFEHVGIPPRLLFVVAALYVVGAVLRLARFNVEPPPPPELAAEEKAKGFTGLPSPAAAAVVASFPIALFGPQLASDAEPSEAAALTDLWAARLLPLVTFGVALLMVSRVRYAHLLKQLLRRGRNRKLLLVVVFAILVVIAVPRVAVPILVCWYAFAPPVMAGWTRYFRGAPPAPAPASGVYPRPVPPNDGTSG
ncbi:MAG: CDP-alcohol phosphatidyltransferase family protein [Gemmataceae bacterium]